MKILHFLFLFHGASRFHATSGITLILDGNVIKLVLGSQNIFSSRLLRILHNVFYALWRERSTRHLNPYNGFLNSDHFYA